MKTEKMVLFRYYDLSEYMIYLVNGNWGAWGVIGRCNANCVKKRTRKCDNPPPSKDGGKQCSGGDGLVQAQHLKCNQRFCGKLSDVIYIV